MPEYYSLPAYGAMLQSLQREGWTHRSLADLVDSGGRDLYLRHDIDAELYLLEPFLDAERASGATATYFLMLESPFYNLASPEGRRIVRRIGADGHAFGLHFFGELHADLTPDQLAEEIHGQTDYLGRAVGADVGVFSFHQPTQPMLDLQLAIPGLVNTYHAETMRDLTYVSDTNMGWRPAPPHELLVGDVRRAQMLVHPLWWLMDAPTPSGRWRQVLDGLSVAHARHLLARERTLAGIEVADLT